MFSITPDSLLCKSESGPSRRLSVKLSLCPYLCLSESVRLLCLSDQSLAEGLFFDLLNSTENINGERNEEIFIEILKFYKG